MGSGVSNMFVKIDQPDIRWRNGNWTQKCSKNKTPTSERRAEKERERESAHEKSSVWDAKLSLNRLIKWIFIHFGSSINSYSTRYVSLCTSSKVKHDRQDIHSETPTTEKKMLNELVAIGIKQTIVYSKMSINPILAK